MPVSGASYEPRRVEASAGMTILLLIATVSLAALAGVYVWGAAHRKTALAERRRSMAAAKSADAMLSAAPGAYIAWDRQDRFIASPRLARWLQLPEAPRSLDDLCSRDGSPGFDPDEFLPLARAVETFRSQGGVLRVCIRDLSGLRRFEISAGPEGAGSASESPLKDILWIREVTEEALDAEALTERLGEAERMRDRLSALIDAAPFPVWWREDNNAVGWANRAYIAAVESPDLATVIREARELSPASLAESPYRMAKKAKEEGALLRSEHNVVVEGALHVFDIVDAPIDPANGRDGGIAGFALDKTDLHECRAELERYGRAHAKTLDALSTAVAIFGPDKSLIFHNNAFEKMWRMDGDWLAGSPHHERVIEAMRENRRLPEQTDFQAWKKGQLNLYTRVIEPMEELWHLPDGAILRVVCQPHPLGGLLFLFEDVTDRFALESSYNTLIAVQRESLDKLFEGVTVFGSDGRLQLFNPAFARIWGLDSAFLGRKPHISDVIDSCGDLMAAEEWDRIRRQILGGAEDRRATMKRLERPDGSVIDYACVPLPDGATLHTYLDVTDSARIERALREHNEALAAADRLKSEFVANVSYQLRTPLNTIIGFSELLEQELYGSLNDQQHSYTTGVLQSADQLRMLIDEILDLAEIEAGVLELKSAEIDLNEMMEAVFSMAKEQARRKDLRVTLDCAPGIGAIEADEKRIKQALFSLVSNAVEFTPEGGKITLGAARNADWITLSVADTGVGMKPGDQEEAFKPFTRGANGGHGIGLGLTLARRFIEMHGGKVSVDPSVEVGTKVDCALPSSLLVKRSLKQGMKTSKRENALGA